MTQYFNRDTRWTKLTNQGHIYIKIPKTKNKWKCVIPECPGEVAVVHMIINFINLHNHAEDYNRIATEFVKEKIVEWGTLNYKVREAKHLDIIYECLSQNILNYMPEKCRIMCLIRNKRRCRRRGQQPQQEQPHQRKFMFSLDEINDYKVAEALAQSHQRLYEYYVNDGIIQPSNPVCNQQQKNFETPDSMIGIMVPEYSLESFCNNTFDKGMFHIDNNNVQKIPYQTSQSYQWNGSEGLTMNNIVYTQALDELESFTENFNNSSNGNNCQGSSPSSVQTIAEASIKADCILLHPDPATPENMLKSSPLDKAINRLYQRQQQQQCCCFSNTNDYESLHRSSLGQIYCSLNIDNDMVDYYNFIQRHGFLNAAETSNSNSFLHENRKIQNESPSIYNGLNVTSNNINNIYSMKATENQNLEPFITDPTFLNILSIPNTDELSQKLIEYEKKLLSGFEEISKIAKNVLKQSQELLEN